MEQPAPKEIWSNLAVVYSRPIVIMADTIIYNMKISMSCRMQTFYRTKFTTVNVMHVNIDFLMRDYNYYTASVCLRIVP